MFILNSSEQTNWVAGWLASIVVLVGVFSAGASRGATQIYFDSSAWHAAAGGSTIYSFTVSPAALTQANEISSAPALGGLGEDTLTFASVSTGFPFDFQFNNEISSIDIYFGLNGGVDYWLGTGPGGHHDWSTSFGPGPLPDKVGWSVFASEQPDTVHVLDAAGFELASAEFPMGAAFVGVISDELIGTVYYNHTQTQQGGNGLKQIEVSVPMPITLNTWNPSILPGTDPASLTAFDATVGITGYAIESFEDPVLIPGLTVEGGAVGTTGVLDPSNNLFTEHPDSLWDFATSMGLNVDDSLIPGDIEFSFPDGVRSVGVGIGDVESDVELFVNDQSFGLVQSLPNFQPTGNVLNQPRQVYIRVDATEGFPDIASVRFTQNSAGSGDIIFFDRVALSPASALPPSVPALGLAARVILTIAIIGVARVASHRRPTRACSRQQTAGRSRIR